MMELFLHINNEDDWIMMTGPASAVLGRFRRVTIHSSELGLVQGREGEFWTNYP